MEKFPYCQMIQDYFVLRQHDTEVGCDNCVNVPPNLLQNTPLCRNNCERKTQKFLESIKIRHNFASEIRNDIAL